MADRWLEPYEEAIGEFPVGASRRETFAAALRLAVRAPSVHNTQPWACRVQRGRLEVHLDWRRWLPVADPEGRQLVMSCGALIEHLFIVLRRFGYDPVIEPVDDDSATLLATVALGGERRVDSVDRLLFRAIGLRRTNRRTFRRRQVPMASLERATRRALQRGVRLAVVAGRRDRGRLVSLVARADRRQMADPAFRRELASWLRPAGTRRADGIPSPSGKAPRLIRPVAPVLVRTFDMGNGVAAFDRRLASGSPALAVLFSDADDRRAWLDSGRGLARLLLSLTADDLAVSFLSQVTEVPDTRAELDEAFGRGQRSQAVLRIGYGGVVPATPRRSVGALLSR